MYGSSYSEKAQAVVHEQKSFILGFSKKKSLFQLTTPFHSSATGIYAEYTTIQNRANLSALDIREAVDGIILS